MNIKKQSELDRKEQLYQHTMKNNITIEDLGHDYEPDLSSEERLTLADLKMEHKKQLTQMEQFLSLEYAYFEHKVNKCLLNRCYDDIYKQRNEVKTCVQECTNGLKQVKSFVSEQFQLTKQQYDQCMDESQKSNYILQSMFRCYNEMNETLKNLKLNIRTELNYYQ